MGNVGNMESNGKNFALKLRVLLHEKIVRVGEMKAIQMNKNDYGVTGGEGG